MKPDMQRRSQYAQVDQLWEAIKAIPDDREFYHEHARIVREFPVILERACYDYPQELTRRIFKKLCLNED